MVPVRSADMARALVDAVARQEGLPAGPVGLPALPGAVNSTVLVGSPGAGWVLRAGAGTYAVERWCADAARAVGIRTPRVLAVGETDGVPWCAQELIGAGRHPDPRDEHWDLLPALVERIGAIDVSDAPDGLFGRFGRDPAAAWRAHLDYNLDALEPGDRLRSLGVYEVGDLPWLRARVRGIADRPVALGLFHGDLCWRNLVLDEAGEGWVIDWGSAAVGPVPDSELVHLRLEADRIDGVRRRSGSVERRLGRDARALVDLELLGALDLVRWAIDRSPAETDDYAARARAVVDRSRSLV